MCENIIIIFEFMETLKLWVLELMYHLQVLVNITQLAGTMHNICKVWGSEPRPPPKNVPSTI